MALAPRKKFMRHPCFNLLLNWFINGKRLIEMGSSFRISLRLYLTLLLQKKFHSNLTTNGTKLSLDSNFSSDCYGDHACSRSFQLVMGSLPSTYTFQSILTCNYELTYYCLLITLAQKCILHYSTLLVGSSDPYRLRNDL